MIDYEVPSLFLTWYMASLKQHENENLLTVLLDVTLWFVSTHYLKGLQFERH